ncbi:dihydrolipoamide acetyltransferase family protein [Sebaldella sp. S0638]|uniref:dihydrolipoamide acetyltransferase family protein n=1 Tax=Sebaldella sp. S0638 TaxID=2957809 RepID=UPI00209E3162|nr:dihydrolipoamide acetyltransferase family protein [Sebaldella sp. S0638]MCP1226488.1 2-oxo acid dehydrogenase subunit E2 [Sebaldella sp. S0638]
MSVEIIMPKAGMSMEEGTIVKWLKNEGDEIKEGEAIVEILTDKVNMEVEAESSGYLLKKVRFEDEVLPVFTVIGYIGEMGETVSETPKTPEKTEIVEEKKPDKKETEENSVFFNKSLMLPDKLNRATPAARKKARDNSLSLGDISGSGPKGRVQLIDVETFLADGTIKATPLARKIAGQEGIDLDSISGTGAKGKIFKRDLTLNAAPEIISKEAELKPYSGIRKVIGDRMTESQFSAPTFTLNIEVGVNKLLKLKDKIAQPLMDETGEKLTINDLLILSISRGVKKYPDINVSLTDKGILCHKEINVGFAVSGNGVLMVPVVKNTEDKGIRNILTEGKDLIKKARDGKLGAAEQSGSTITLSNLGMYGVHYFNPIINQPNSCIIGVGTIEEKPVAKDGKIKIKKVIYLSATFDHRVIDGALGAEFMQYIKKLIEDPYSLLI